MTTIIDIGDHVHHGPSGEDWVVGRVRGDRLAWLGWPQGWAELKDCTLIHKARDAKRIETLRSVANSIGHHLSSWAAERLQKEGHAET